MQFVHIVCLHLATQVFKTMLASKTTSEIEEERPLSQLIVSKNRNAPQLFIIYRLLVKGHLPSNLFPVWESLDAPVSVELHQQSGLLFIRVISRVKELDCPAASGVRYRSFVNEIFDI